MNSTVRQGVLVLCGLAVLASLSCRDGLWTPRERSPGGWIKGRPDCPEPYTIWCIDYDGPEHRRLVENLAKLLGAAMDPAKAKVVHDDEAQVSTLYYGEYCPSTRGEQLFPPGSPARKDLATIQLLATQEEYARYPFGFARLQPAPLESKDDGPPEWNIANARKKLSVPDGAIVYTLAICVYYDTPERRKAAVDAVRALREKDHVDAYYFHYPSKSLVMVGLFVVKEQDLSRSRGGAAANQQAFNDPKIREYISKYPHWLENGELRRRMYKTADGAEVPVQGDELAPSRIMEVPSGVER